MEPRDYIKKYLTEGRVKALIARGCCPLCELKLTSPFHTDCPYLKVINSEKTPEPLLFDK